MPLAAGQTLTHYEILGPLGAGGMGEVYRAKDTRLDREVAIKVLPEHFADDEERLRRFEREAKTLASLNHPNVAGIHGIDQLGDTCFLAMELVPGEDLEARLRRGALPLDEALDVCRQIAEGLEAAHEAGVVHRDLKPANVRITPDGVVKILDFGLAKPIRPKTSGESGATTAESDSFLVTEEGLVLGTPTYMSPEQARGKPVDRRTDVWAFGCVLYECLAGKRAFSGGSLTDVLAAIVDREPDGSALPAATPPHVRALLERCLEKQPRNRLRDVGEARVLLERGAPHPAPAELATRSAAAHPVVLGLVSALLGAALVRVLAPGWAAEPAVGRLQSELVAPPGTWIDAYKGPPALSGDGARVAFAVVDGTGRSALWIRELETGELRRLPGTENGREPFWSPTGLELGFLQNSQLLAIGIDESRPRVIAESETGITGASWGDSGTILFGQLDGPLMQVAERGGVPEVVLDPFPENPEAWAMWPHHLPDGNGFLFAIQDRTGQSSGLYACRAGSTGWTRLTNETTNAIYLASGRLLFRRDTSLHWVDFDPETFALGKDSTRVAKDVRLHDWPIHALFGASPGGRIVYMHQQPGLVHSEFVWYDIETGETEPLGIEGILWNPCLSPDGTRLAFDRTTIRSSGDVWVRDLERGGEVQITDGPSDDSYPLWTPGGDQLYFYVTPSIFRSDPMGLREPELVLRGVHGQAPQDLTADGKRLLFSGRPDTGGPDRLSVLDLESKEVTAVLEWDGGIGKAELSPDDAWFAVRLWGDETAIVVASFPDARHATRVPCEGGAGLRWSRDGRELYFSSDDELIGLPLELAAGTAPVPGKSRVIVPRNRDLRPSQRFDVSVDGRRLLLVRAGTPERREPLTLLEGAIP